MGTRSKQIAEFGFLRLDARRKTPLFRQLYEQLRLAVLQGRLQANDRIPSSRDLVKQLGISRTTAVTAIELLISEGYLQTIHGRGTFVCSEIPDEVLLPADVAELSSLESRGSTNYLSAFGRAAESFDRSQWHTGAPVPFCPGEPALDEFPIEVWSRIVRRVWKSASVSDLSYGEPAGHPTLRAQIADYLSVHRGVNCSASQVMIVNGTQQAVDIISRIALNPGDPVLFENPGYLSARNAFEKRGNDIIPLAVDDEGIQIREAIEQDVDARLAYVTPSHQFPMGVTLPIERRMELIKWAEDHDALILEDDYDSEYRYSGRPLPSLQGLDRSARTIYVGSFSKVVFPALGLGYAIVPPPMITAFENALKLSSRPGSKIDQIVLSEFIREGHFVRHLRKMRKTHSERRETFVAAFEKHLADKLTLVGAAAGLHCTTLFDSPKVSDTHSVAHLAKAGIIARPLSSYFADSTPRTRRRNGLVFGFASATPGTTKRRLREVGKLLDEVT
ncbi:MAG: PLP-dependent aminotransferase family protein [Pirellulaceae bacterium]